MTVMVDDPVSFDIDALRRRIAQAEALATTDPVRAPLLAARREALAIHEAALKELAAEDQTREDRC